MMNTFMEFNANTPRLERPLFRSFKILVNVDVTVNRVRLKPGK
jgi:hypothetical protein